MSEPSDPAPQQPPARQPTRAEQRGLRLKAALKANMARRKAQVRGRAGQGPATSQAHDDTETT